MRVYIVMAGETATYADMEVVPRIGEYVAVVEGGSHDGQFMRVASVRHIVHNRDEDERDHYVTLLVEPTDDVATVHPPSTDE